MNKSKEKMKALYNTGDLAELQQLLEKVYRERSFDFREYRVSTLSRRIGRRMRARRAEGFSGYARVLDADPGEYSRLFNDLTINVTSFFRDRIAFNSLKETVLPRILANNQEQGGGARIWSAACSNGAEPYSIAMLLHEISTSHKMLNGITILGTDLDPKVIDQARKGCFSRKEAEGIDPAWLDKYFTPEDDTVCAGPQLRGHVEFQTHDLTSDFPYPDVDLLVCRNVLIYFLPILQNRVLKGFHEALRPGGFLLLGKAEMPPGETRHLFDCIDKKARLYGKK